MNENAHPTKLPLETNSSQLVTPVFPEGGTKAWSAVLGSSIALGCAFGYLSAFG